MNKYFHVLCVAIGGLLLAGCATPKPTVSCAPRVSQQSDATYAIMPFVDGNSEKDRTAYPQAAAVMSSAFETALLQTGRKIVSPGGEDITVTGVMTAFYQGHFAGPNTTVGLDVKAVDKKTGTVLWKVSHTKRTKWEYDFPPGELAQEVAREVVKQLDAAGKKR